MGEAPVADLAQPLIDGLEQLLPAAALDQVHVGFIQVVEIVRPPHRRQGPDLQDADGVLGLEVGLQLGDPLGGRLGIGRRAQLQGHKPVVNLP